MSQAGVEQVIGKLVMDPEFRAAVAKDANAALAGYDLTDEERDGLSRVDASSFEQAASALDERATKAFLGPRR